MKIAEVFTRKLKDKEGNVFEEDWVAIKKQSGKIIKLMSLENYLNTNQYHPAIL